MKVGYAARSTSFCLRSGMVLVLLMLCGCGAAPSGLRSGETPEAAVAEDPASQAADAAAEPAGTPTSFASEAEAEAEQPAPRDPPQPGAPEAPGVLAERSPFPHRVEVPDFPRDATWLNTAGPLRKQDLKGKFVLLDFWTYCCINCIHILPELKKLERAYPNELVVIGVHSAKFSAEEDAKNIEEAILRYEIEHPVVNDSDHRIWDTYGVNSWPTVLLIDPEGYAVWGRSGEIRFEDVDPLLQAGLAYYRARKVVDDSPIRFELLRDRQAPTPLRFPGKVLADEAQGRLFISDSNHNRIVIAGLDGRLLDTIGSGAIGRKDGKFDAASFHHPQGMALSGDTLYVADTENHLLRKVDLQQRSVTTIAGTGQQSRSPWPAGPAEGKTNRWMGTPSETALNSPWDLWVHDKQLYIAMAGPHQIWRMALDESEIGPYAGNGREDIIDGPLLPEVPYQPGYSSFAQPSGLTSDGKYLYVADSEGSSIRAVPFDPQGEVQTVVGTAQLPYARLFTFGDVDGEREQVRLQHALGVAYHEGQLYVADTYNNKIKVVDAETGQTRTLAGSGKPGSENDPAQFDEPAGLAYAGGKLYIADTNNHLVRVVDVSSGAVTNFTVADLAPPQQPRESRKPDFSRAPQVAVEPVTIKAGDKELKVELQLELPSGWKINELAPVTYYVDSERSEGPLDRNAFGPQRLPTPAASFTFTVPITGGGEDELQVSLPYFYCQEGGEGLCKVGSVVWKVPLRVLPEGPSQTAVLKHRVTP